MITPLIIREIDNEMKFKAAICRVVEIAPVKPGTAK